MAEGLGLKIACARDFSKTPSLVTQQEMDTQLFFKAWEGEDGKEVAPHLSYSWYKLGTFTLCWL